MAFWLAWLSTRPGAKGWGRVQTLRGYGTKIRVGTGITPRGGCRDREKSAKTTLSKCLCGD